MLLTRLYDATNNAIVDTKVLWTFMWCGNSHGINMCATYLEVMQSLNKFAQNRDTFIWDFVSIVLVVSIWNLHHVCGAWEIIFPWSISSIHGFGDIQKWCPMDWVADWFRIACENC
jgi:hypothetical protein